MLLATWSLMRIYNLKIWRCKICRTKDENKGNAENIKRYVFKCFQKWQVLMVCIYMFGRDKAVIIGPRYGLGSNHWGGEINCTSPHRTRGLPNSYTTGKGSFPGVNPPRSALTTHLHLAPTCLFDRLYGGLRICTHQLTHSVLSWDLCWSVSHLKSFLKRVNMKKYAGHSGHACFIVLPLKTCIYVVKVNMSNLRAWRGT